MVRKIKINGSDKIICKHFDNGYCRFKEECRFLHLKENCESDQCDLNVCLKRHPKFCKYFRRKKCKFGDECLFKHKNGLIMQRDKGDKMDELKDKLKDMEKTLKNFMTENRKKDSEIEQLRDKFC